MGRWFSTSISSRIPSENCDVQVEKESREERNFSGEQSGVGLHLEAGLIQHRLTRRQDAFAAS